jgi:predicted MFS family arabinose efflux permease
LYPVYAVLFTETGLSPAAISSLFVVWSVTSFVVEVPSGLWADVVSRRYLVALAPALSGVAFGVWTALPSYPSFAVGFMLWGAGGAVQSGALQALVYSELDRLGATDAYESLIGRSQALGTTAAMIASGLAAPVLAVGGYPALGAASVAACLLAAVVGLSLPDSRAPVAVPEPADSELTYAVALRRGLDQLRHARPVRRAVAVIAVLSGLGSLDEYLPLLAQSTGVDGPTVALLVLLITVGSVAGGWFAGRGTRRMPSVLAVGAVFLAVGAAGGRPAGAVLLAVAYGTFQWAMVGADARLQERVPDQVRATVTSIAGLGSEVGAVTAFGGYALGSVWLGPGPLFVLAAVGYLVVALAAVRFRQARTIDGGRPDRPPDTDAAAADAVAPSHPS